MGGKHVLRFAVCDDSDRRSGTWRVFFDDHSVYVAVRSLGDDFKVSIHYPKPGATGTVRYAGFTRKKARALGWSETARRQDRAVSEWRGYEFAPGYFVEYAMRFLPDELRAFESDDEGDVYWLSVGQADEAIEVALISAPAHHEGLCPSRADGGEMEILHEVELPGLRRVWIVAHLIPRPTAAEVAEWRSLARFLSPHTSLEPHSRFVVDL